MCGLTPSFTVTLMPYVPGTSGTKDADPATNSAYAGSAPLVLGVLVTQEGLLGALGAKVTVSELELTYAAKEVVVVELIVAFVVTVELEDTTYALLPQVCTGVDHTGTKPAVNPV